MNEKNVTQVKKDYKLETDLLSFWMNLKTGYDSFKETKKELNINVNKNGDYIFE